MSHTIPRGDRQDKILSLIDDFCAVGRDLAREIAITWLESQADQADRAGAGAIAPAQGEKLLTLSELAARMGRDPRTIQEWEKDFGLPSLRAHPNADPLFDWREVLEWMRRHRDHKNDYIEGRGNGKIASAPIGTRPQATQRRS